MFVNNDHMATMIRFPLKRTTIVLALSLLLGACSVLKEDKVDYKSAVKAPSLEIPPDLTQLRRESRFALESTSASASGFRNASTLVGDAGTAANTLGKVRMERNFALDKAEVEAGFVLTCQAHPLTERLILSFDER